MEPFRVLVIDDSSVIRAMMTGVFENNREFFVVGAVASAADAELVLRRELVDVVTLDVEMPGVNGLEFLPNLVKRKIPVVMLSGHTAQGADVRSQALKLGAAACFNKADAIKNASELLRLVKAAAKHTVRLNPADIAARNLKEPLAEQPVLIETDCNSSEYSADPDIQ